MSNPRPQPLTLKQRLAAIQNLNASTTSALPTPPTSPTSPTTIKKIKLPWRRNTSESPVRSLSNSFRVHSGGGAHPSASTNNRDLEERQALQDVLSRLIFQAGVDYETRPMIVIAASALPDPKRVCYDLLLERILSYLNLYVESDYTLVFFAATSPGRSYTPGWNWVWKAYRGLDRKWRKNLKRLLIVHPSFFTKMLFSLGGAFISPKFNQKITYVPTLSMLAKEVPLTQIDVPAVAYSENTKFEKKIQLPDEGFGALGRDNANRMFGVPLEDIMGYDGEKSGIPRVVRDCIRTLREGAMQEQGIFRRSPSTSMLNAAKDAYDRGNAISLSEFSRSDPHLCAVLLKKYLRDLPEPIFPEEMYGILTQCPNPYSGDDENESAWEAIRYIRETLLPEVVPCRAILLSAVLHVLHETSLHSHANMMDAYNLSVVLTPNLVKGGNIIRDMALCVVQGPSAHPRSHGPHSNDSTLASAQQQHKATLGTIIKLCIERYYEVFDETMDRGDALPVTRSVLRQFSGDNPMSVSDGEEEEEPPYSGATIQVTDFAKHERRWADETEDEEIDDTALVMPIGPPGHGRNGSTFGVPVVSTFPQIPSPKHSPLLNHKSPPASRRSSLQVRDMPPSPNSNVPSSFRPTHRTTLSKSSASSSGSRSRKAPSSFSYSPGTSSPPSFSLGTLGKSKAKSVVSIDSSDHGALSSGRGSISVGTKGSTIRGKSGASGVEAVGVLAEGFFSAPGTSLATASPTPH